VKPGKATREEYTWLMAARDLALTTPLRLEDTGGLLAPLEGLMHPYDALPHLRALFDPEGLKLGIQGKALAQLILLGKEQQ
jgi:hypothetical protein